MDKVNLIKSLDPSACIGQMLSLGSQGKQMTILDTYNFIRDLDLAYLHVFSYSERITLMQRVIKTLSQRLKDQKEVEYSVTFLMKNVTSFKSSI